MMRSRRLALDGLDRKRAETFRFDGTRSFDHHIEAGQLWRSGACKQKQCDRDTASCDTNSHFEPPRYRRADFMTGMDERLMTLSDAFAERRLTGLIEAARGSQ